MPRLIDADAKELLNRININFSGVTRFVVKSILKDAPTIDAVPVVHGRWKSGGILNECQVCGEIYSLNGGNVWKPWNYCPNCGAKMDGEADG
jgi:hypothetical protein